MIYKQDGQLLFPRWVPVVVTQSLPTLQMTYYADDGLMNPRRAPVVFIPSLPTLQMTYKLTMGSRTRTDTRRDDSKVTYSSDDLIC
jgi:hypothetical protein